MANITIAELLKSKRDEILETWLEVIDRESGSSSSSSTRSTDMLMSKEALRTEAKGLADAVLAGVQALRIERVNSQVGRYVALSLGVASMNPEHDQRDIALIQSADKALYLAKESGRNRIESAA